MLADKPPSRTREDVLFSGLGPTSETVGIQPSSQLRENGPYWLKPWAYPSVRRKSWRRDLPLAIPGPAVARCGVS